MIMNKYLVTFMSIIENADLSFNPITEKELRGKFRNNLYYNLLHYCLTNNLIYIEYHKVILTSRGRKLFNILKDLNNI